MGAANHAREPELQLPTSMICNNIETRVCFALQGLGIAYLPEFSIREPLADGRLQPLLPTIWNAVAFFMCCGRQASTRRQRYGHWLISCARGCSRLPDLPMIHVVFGG
jgi:DNA-binding transcriptional LysR family regulator